jgi:hypothetical protein
MIKIDIYKTNPFSREEIEIQESNIKLFESISRKDYTRKGAFKKFYKQYYIQLKTGEYFNIPESSFKLLKESLKGQYKSSHSTETVIKNYSERKSTDWKYRID